MPVNHEVIDRIEKNAHETIDKVDLIRSLDKRLNGCKNVNVTMNSFGDIYMVITSLEHLTEARQAARIIEPEFRGEYKGAYENFLGEVNATWEDRPLSPIKIRLDTNHEDFPKELLGENCHWQTVTEKRNVMVCG